MIAVLKAHASKFGVQKITVENGVGALWFADIQSFADKRMAAALDKYKDGVRLNMTQAATVEFYKGKNAADLMAQMTKFLKFALTFTNQ